MKFQNVRGVRSLRYAVVEVGGANFNTVTAAFISDSAAEVWRSTLPYPELWEVVELQDDLGYVRR